VTDADLDELLRVPPSEFVAARRDLAHRLKADGQRARADEVAKLRRPPVTAWALDRVAHDHPEAITDLLAIGERLRSATSNALRGDASDLRAIRADERSAVDLVVHHGLDAVTATGQKAGEPLRQRMAATVRAALGDEQIARALAVGRLVDEYEPTGFGFSTADLKAAITPPKLRSVPDLEPDGPSPAQAERARRLGVKAQQLRKEAGELDARACAAETEATRLRDQANTAAEAADRAEERAKTASESN